MKNPKKRFDKKAIVVATLALIVTSPYVLAQEEVLFQKQEAHQSEHPIDNSGFENLKKTGTIIIHNQNGDADRVYEINSIDLNNNGELTPVVTSGEDILFKQDFNDYQYRISTLDKAIQKGDIASLNNMRAFNPNQETYNGNTIVNISGLRGNFELIEFAISKNANITKKNKDGLNLVHLAAQTGNLDFLKKAKGIIKDEQWKSLINQIDNMGRNPLHLAALHSNSEMAKFLAKEAELVNQKDKMGMTPAFYCIALGKWQVLGVLLENKADLSLKINEAEIDTYEDILMRKIPVFDIATVMEYLSNDNKKIVVEKIDKIIFAFKDDERYKRMK